MSNPDVDVRFGANTEELKNGMASLQSDMASRFASIKGLFERFSANAKESSDMVKKSLEGVKGVTDGLKSTFEGLSVTLKVVGAAIAGGAAFKEAIGAVAAEAGEVRKLANTFGMTAEAASQMNLQLKLVGMSSDDYIGIAMKFDRQLKTSEQGLNKLGVATRDSNGGLLPQAQLLQNAASAMMEYKAGTDRNAFAMNAFGKSAQEAYQLIKLNTESQNTAQRLQELGLGLDQEELDSIKSYNLAKNESKVVMEGFVTMIGGSVVPMVTSLSKAFNHISESVIPVFKSLMNSLGGVFSAIGQTVLEFTDDLIETAKAIYGAVDGAFKYLFGDVDMLKALFASLTTVVQLVKFVFLEAFQLITFSVNLAVEAIKTLASITAHVLDLDWSGAVKAADDGTKRIEDLATKHRERMAQIGNETRQNIIDSWDLDKKKESSEKKGSEGKSYQAPDKGKVDLSPYEQELAAIKHNMLVEQSGREMSTEQELAFWGTKLSAVKTGSDMYIALQGKMFAGEDKLIKDNRDAYLASLKSKIDAAKGNFDAQIAAAKVVQAEEIRLHDLGSKEAIAAGDKIIALEREKAQALIAIDAQRFDAKIKMSAEDEKATKEAAKQSLQFGQITAVQEIQISQQAAMKQIQIEMDLLAKKRDLYQAGTKEWEAENNKIIAAAQSYNVKMDQLSADAAFKTKQEWDKASSGIQGAMTSSFGGLLMATTSLQNGFQQICQTMVKDFMDACAQMGARWLLTQTSQTTIGQQYAALRASMEVASTTRSAATAATSDASQTASTKVMAAATIPAEAAIAAGGAAASVASTPYVGPALAAEAYASTLAMVMGGLGIASSAGGDWNVGSDRLNFVHKKETIMPARVAEPMRNFFEGGGASGSGDTHFHINAVDAQGVKNLFMNNGAALTAAAKAAMRNFRK